MTTSLHLCNLANVAYGYCKVLRNTDGGAAHDATLRCHDLRHLMSQPEWDDLALFADDFPDENNFWDNTADFGDYQRPDWFESADLLTGLPAGAPTHSRLAGRRGGTRLRRTWEGLPESTRRAVKPVVRQAQFLARGRHDGTSAAAARAAWADLSGPRLDEIVAQSRQHAPEFHLERRMLSSYVPHAWWVRRHAERAAADAIVAYVLAPIYAMIAGGGPTVALEIGTMREIPFDGTDTGRVLAQAYRNADHVIITNPDVRAAADRLGLDSYSFVPHPLDETRYTPAVGTDAVRRSLDLRQKLDADHVLFAPARQNWAVKGNDRYLRAFAAICAERSDTVLIIPGWGQEVERTKALCRDLNIAHRVEWIRPQSEASLIHYYQSADVVLDQFVLGVFGLITPKALACGATVITSYDRSLHAWAFAEDPPVMGASTSDEIAACLRTVLDNREFREQRSAESRKWIMRHHSSPVIRSAFEAALGAASERHAS